MTVQLFSSQYWLLNISHILIYKYNSLREDEKENNYLKSNMQCGLFLRLHTHMVCICLTFIYFLHSHVSIYESTYNMQSLEYVIRKPLALVFIYKNTIFLSSGSLYLIMSKMKSNVLDTDTLKQCLERCVESNRHNTKYLWL